MPPLFEVEGSHVVVNVDYHLKDIPRVDTKLQEIEVDVVLGFRWEDLRLDTSGREANFSMDHWGEYVVFPGEHANNLWMPDIYLDKTPTVRNPIYMSDASSVRLYKNGFVRFTTQLNFDTHCEMNFNYFPFDKQVCSINIESFGYTTDEMELKWEDSGMIDEIDQVRGRNGLELYSHSIKLKRLKLVEDEEFYRLVLEGMGMVVTMQVTLVRKLNYFITNYYIPSALLATVAYSSLYLAPTMKVPRIGMNLVTLISVNTRINSIKKEMPRVTYMTMSDIWLFPITYYCCLCLFEFLVVQYLIELEQERRAKRVEFWCRIIFAVCPLLFTAVYVAVALQFGFTWDAVAIPRSELCDERDM